MIKILIIAYYNLNNALKHAADALIQNDIEVDSFPLFKYHKDAISKVDNYDELLINYINMHQPDYILWWYVNIPTYMFKNIISNIKKINHFLFNWDDPYNRYDCDLINKAKYFDIVYVTSEYNLDYYTNNGTHKAIYLLPGYNPLIHYPIDSNPIDFYSLKNSNPYICDISFCCTNLYDDNTYDNQYINRKKLIDDLYEAQQKCNFKLNLYGTKVLNIYPLSYKGYVPYDETNMVYNCSKINLCTHVQQNAYKYINERTIQILGSGGLLLIDKVDGLEQILTPDEDCIILDKNNYVEQIINILKNYDNYTYIKHNGHNKSLQYTWNEWAKEIVSNL